MLAIISKEVLSRGDRNRRGDEILGQGGAEAEGGVRARLRTGEGDAIRIAPGRRAERAWRRGREAGSVARRSARGRPGGRDLAHDQGVDPARQEDARLRLFAEWLNYLAGSTRGTPLFADFP